MAAETPSLGLRVAGRWELTRVVGSGGMGTVFCAIDLSTGQEVALKLMHEAEGRNEERFLREAKLLSDLRHPGIVSYLAHGLMADGRQYLVMEWLDGEDLSHRLRRAEPMSVGQILDLVIQVADALAFAHARGIVHRDIKPENVFVHRGKDAKLLDFGIARKLSSERLTQTGAVIGTIEYMAPEQVRGSRDLGGSADIYSLGCLLYQCLCGEPPFTGVHAAAILARILFEEPQHLQLRNPSLPTELSSLVQSMLSKDPALRPQEVVTPLRKIRAQVSDQLMPVVKESARPHFKSVMTHGELRMITAVLASPSRGAVGLLDSTLQRSGNVVRIEDTQDLGIPASVGSYPGVRVSVLADGWLLAVFDPVGQIGLLEQVVNAAQLAQDIVQLRPMTQVAIAVAQQGATERQILGPLVELCTKLLARANEEESVIARAPGIWLDDVSSGVLSARFAVEKGTYGTRLMAPRTTQDSQDLFLGKPRQFIGRDIELSMLELWSGACFEESIARAVLLLSSAGVGKSRLVQEFLHRLKRRDIAHLQLFARCDALTESTPYGPLQRAIRGLCMVQAGQERALQQERLASLIARYVRPSEQKRVAEFIGELIGVPFSDKNSPQLAAARHDPKVMSDQIVAALIDFVRAACSVGPVVMILEDFHFCDLLSVRVLEAMLLELHSLPLFILAAARNEVTEKFPELWIGIQKDVLQLRPLSRKACERLASQVLAGKVPSELIERVILLADGNPLFLEELMRSVSLGGSDALPVSVLAVLQHRVHGLPPDARRILRAASIFGDTFWKGGLSELVGLSSQSVEEWLLFLCRAEVIERHRQSRLAGEVEYAFRHTLMREALYQMVMSDDRKVGHGLAAAYLRKMGEVDSFVLAAHHEKAGDLTSAGTELSRAAAQCLARFDLVGARKSALRALDLGIRDAVRGSACSLLAQSLYWSSEWEPVPKWAQEALDLCPLGSVEYCRALGVYMMTAVMSGKQDVVGELVGRFLQTDPETIAIDAYVETGNFMVLMFVMVAERALVDAFLSRLQQVVAKVSEHSLSRAMLSFCHGAYLRLLAPQPWQAVELLRDAVLRFHRAGDTRNEALSACILALAEREVGQYESGVRTLGQALQIAEKLAGTVMPTVQMHIAMLQASSSRQEDRTNAPIAAQKVIDGFAENAVYVALAKAIVAKDLLQNGKQNEALALIESAYQSLRMTPTMQAIVLPSLIDMHRQCGHIDVAVSMAADLRALLEKLGDAGYLEAVCRLAIGDALQAAGQTEEARAIYQSAAAHVRLRASHAPDESSRETFLSAVPENVRVVFLTSS